MRNPLQRLWRFLVQQPARPAVEDPGPVDAIVRLLKSEQVRLNARSKGSGEALEPHE